MEFQTQVIKFFAGKTMTGKDKWDVYLADGTKATAFEYAIAAKAQQAFQSGATVKVTITEKPNPNGGNPYRNLTDVSGAAEGLTQPQAAQVIPQSTAGRQNGSQSLTGGSMTPEDKIRVTKLSCISSAAQINSGSGDVEGTLEIAKTIFAEVMGQQAAPVAVAAEPQAVAQFVTEQAGAPVVQVGAEAKPETAPLPWAVA